MEPVARIEAWRLAARCRNDVAAKGEALDLAIEKSRAMGYKFMERLCNEDKTLLGC